MPRIDTQLMTVAKMLRIALGYDSREARIAALLNSTDLNVGMMARVLKANGLLKDHTVNVRDSD